MVGCFISCFVRGDAGRVRSMALNDLPLRSITARSDFEPLTGVRAHTWPYNLAVTRAALAGLTFGQLTIIVGENGAGKSSLIESIAEAYGLPIFLGAA